MAVGTAVAASNATLATKVYHRLRDELLSGRIPPGAKLKVQIIVDEFGVGASPVREALSSLAAEGLVNRADQRGFRAAPISIEDYAELTHARTTAEVAVLRESIVSGDHEWEEKLLVANHRLGRLERVGVRHDDQGWKEAHAEFHRVLLAGCKSPTLLAFCSSLRERSDLYRSMTVNSTTYPAREIACEHEAIAAAALARDGDAASELIAHHYKCGAARIAQRLELLQATREEEGLP